MNRETTAADHLPFSEAEAIFDGFAHADIVELAYCAGDFVLAIDADQVVRDVAVNVHDIGFAQQWIGRRWVDTVAIDSRDKVEQLLAGDGRNWRQVNHGDTEDMVAVRYRVIRPQGSDWCFAIGRDMRPLAAMQQRLLKAQQAMERDYLKLRQTETRYRLLFDAVSYPVLIVDASSLTVQQANRAGQQMLDAAAIKGDGALLARLFAPEARDAIAAYLGALAVNQHVEPICVPLPAGAGSVTLSASPFRQAGDLFWMVSVDTGASAAAASGDDRLIADIVDDMPDAFVLADDRLHILAANRAFVEMMQAGSAQQLVGRPLEGLIGRAEVDLPLLRKQLRDHNQLRSFSTIINDLAGGEEPVELSAVRVNNGRPLFGLMLRSVARRGHDTTPDDSPFPRSVEQLTDLIGRKSLKQIVRESTDLIERMCIEAALNHTADNRASAAEILGISRQSLYSKLHQHGLGNLEDRD